MNVGVSVPHFRHLASPEAILAVARRAEELGYHALWVTDHIVLPPEHVPRFGEVFYEPLTVLSFLAAHTRRVKLGTSAIILPYRNPLVLAKALATADVLSGGRLIVGVAAGWMEPEFDALGLPFAERGRRTREYVRILKHLWTVDEPDFTGKFYRIRNVRFFPKPIQMPHPPIWLGGMSAAALRRAAEVADGWHPVRTSPEDLTTGLQAIREAADRAGRNLEGFEVCLRLPLRILDGPPARPYAEGLIDTLDGIRHRLVRYREAGVTSLLCDLFYSYPELEGQRLPDVLETMERFAREILPTL